MKSLLISIALLIAYNSIFAQAGWYQQNSGTNLNLRFYHSQYEMVLGDNGNYLESTNGGLNWYINNIGFTQNLNFRCEELNIIVGDNGLILKASGPNWIQIPSGTNENLKSVFFVTNSGLIVGNNGKILKSTNGGNNWTAIFINSNQNLNSVYYNYIAGDGGLILKSTDAGNNWIQLNSGISENLNNIVYFDYDSLMVCGNNGKVLFSSNGGNTWVNRSPGIIQNLNYIYKYYFITSSNLEKIWIVGDNGTIIYTEDYGINWINSNSGTNKNLKCIGGYNLNLYAVGNEGTILNYGLGSGYFDSTFIDANMAKSYITNDGTIHRKFINSAEGFIWPKTTNFTAIYNSGLLIAAKINDTVRAAVNYYDGECFPGYVDFSTQIPHGKNDLFYRIYKVSPNYPSGSGAFDSWNVWPVNQGAPWIDMNNNGIYEPPNDKPVMKGDQNTFCRFTDGYPESHTSYGGHSKPLNADFLLYTYALANQLCADIHFLEYRIINKKNTRWDSTYIGFYSDIDLGFASYNKMGCDTNLNLGFCYERSNYSPYYGTAPPALGIVLFYVSGHNGRYMDYFNHPVKNGYEPRNANEAYLLLKGLKTDGTTWINPINNLPTNYVYSGDPEMGTGWLYSYPSDIRILLSSKINNVNPLDTIKFYVATIIKRGSNNINSVTQIKNCINQGVIGIREPSKYIPITFRLYQNYPNPFNPVTTIKYDIPVKTTVKIVIYDILGRVINTLINNQIIEPGSHEMDWDGTNFSSGVYFYKIEAGNFTSFKKMILVK